MKKWIVSLLAVTVLAIGGATAQAKPVATPGGVHQYPGSIKEYPAGGVNRVSRSMGFNCYGGVTVSKSGTFYVQGFFNLACTANTPLEIKSTTCLIRNGAAINCASRTAWAQSTTQTITHFCDYTTFPYSWYATVATQTFGADGSYANVYRNSGTISALCF